MSASYFPAPFSVHSFSYFLYLSEVFCKRSIHSWCYKSSIMHNIPVVIREDILNVFSSRANISKRWVIHPLFSTDTREYFRINNRKSLQASKIFATKDFRKNPSQECRFLTKENLYRRIHKNIVSIKRYSKSRIFKFETVFCDYLGMSFFPLLPSVRPRQSCIHTFI